MNSLAFSKEDKLKFVKIIKQNFPEEYEDNQFVSKGVAKNEAWENALPALQTIKNRKQSKKAAHMMWKSIVGDKTTK